MSKEEFTSERCEYLDGLADDYGVDRHAVYVLADLLGPNEDYDGLVSDLEDFGEMMLDWE